MDPFSGNCEIMEVNEDLSSSQRYLTSIQARQHHKERQPLVLPKGSSKSIQDDINKLFEAIAFRTSNGLNLSDHPSTSFSRKNASKKPMRGGPSISTGIGFSEPVSLKQALRGLCISQAGEMAAKRLSKSPGSPGILDAGGSSSMHRADGETTESGTSTPGIVDIGRRSSRPRTVVETTESGASLTESRDREGMVEISLVPEESSSSYLDIKLGKLKEPKMRLADQSSYSSPGFAVNQDLNSGECFLALNVVPSASSEVQSQSFGASHFEKGSRESKIKVSSENETILSKFDHVSDDSTQSHNDVVPATHEAGPQLLVTTATGKESHTSNSGFPDYYSGDDSLKCNTSTLCLSTAPSSPNKKVGSSSKLASQVTPKLRRNAKSPTSSSSTGVKSSKQGKSIRSTSRAVKPAIRKKNLPVKKLKPERVITASNSMMSEDIGSSDYGSMQLICQKCQCSVRDIKKEPDKDSVVPFDNAKTGAFAATNCRIFDTSGQGSVMKGSESTIATAGKGSRVTKFKQKGEFSQSSKSSMGEYSTSTSVSDDSNVSGSTCGNRPHMSKDFRWEAISNVKKQHGFLGLKHFNLIKKLGFGDIGTVYLAELVGTNCPFAIKVMDNEFLARRKKMPRARTEREILRMLDHPFLPTLYAQFTSDNLSCLVMEFCPGGDLHVLRQKQPGRCFPEQEARFYVAEVLLALEYLHMLGIVYRDLKPENIMVREDGHIMLTDFDLSLRCSVNPTLLSSPSVGIEPPRISGPCAGANCIDPFCTGPSCKVSCFTPRMFPNAAARARKLKAEQAAQSRSLPQLVVEPVEARSNSFVGTHEYLAPEIIKGEGHGSAVDWWTLGVFLYELLYGRTPFRGPGNEETLANVVLQSLRFPNSPMVSFQARDLIRGLLVKEPENRFGTETGAAEIKRHPFFDGLNWALIRCAVPPQIPEFCDVTVPNVTLQEKGKTFLEYSATGEPLEFELF